MELAEKHKSCGAIVLFKGKVLLIKGERSKIWGFPKGHVEVGETEEQTALREVKEETGLDVTIIPGFRESIHYTYRERSNRVDKETVFFLAAATTSITTPQRDEVATCKWFHPHEAMEKITFDEVKALLARALEVAR